MKNKYSIGFFVAAMAAVVALSGAYRFSYEKAKAKAAEELKIEIQAENEKKKELQTEETTGKRTQHGSIFSGWTGSKRRLLLSDGGQWICGGLSK